MAAIGSHEPGAPCWIDLSTSDLDRAQRFYGQLFGWTFEDTGPEFGHYTICSKDGATVAGMMAKQDENMPDTWTIYLATNDADSTAAKIAATGGQVLVPPMKVGTLGTMMVAVDPGGAVVGAWEAAEFVGVQRQGDHGTPIWYEVLSVDYERVLPFYRDAFGWDVHTMSDSPTFRYSTLGENDGAKAGIMDVRGTEMPSAWMVYLSCDDVDATAAKLNQLGGREIMPLQDSPYGRLGTFTDPTGAVFALMTQRG